MSQTEHPERSFPNRREFVALGIGAFVVAASLPGALRRRRRLVRRSVPVMGTIADIAVAHRDPSYAQRAIDSAIAELRFVDRTMTRFTYESDVGRANLKASTGPVAISAETAQVLDEALRWAEASEGAFDPCLAKAAVLWDVGRRQSPPPTEAVRMLSGRELYKALELGSRAGEPVILFRDDDVALDLGGIAKGYAVDRAADALRSFGIYNAVVNVGGDLYALGLSADGDPWKIGIRDPDDPEGLIATVEVSDRAIATSGDYIQYFQHGGRRYHHIVDPKTGEPRHSRTRSVTVMASTCMAADAAGTTVFGMEPSVAAGVMRAVVPDAHIAHSV